MTYTLPFQPGQRLLELGGGESPVLKEIGALNLDARPLPQVDIVADFHQGLPVDDSSFDGVLGVYILEHISWRRVSAFVREVARALKPGGVACFVTANTEAQLRWALEQPKGHDWVQRVSQCLFGDQSYENDDWVRNAHFVAFSPQALVNLFLSEGFSKAEVYEHPATPTDMIVEALK